jgi:hypothetical protein
MSDFTPPSHARQVARTLVAQAWTNATPVSAADVASDVWEPLLREALELVLVPDSLFTDEHHGKILDRLQEALGAS